VLSSSASNLLQQLDTYREPTSYEEVATKPQWLEAMKKEFDALEANNTWVLTPLPLGKNPSVASGFINSNIKLMVL